VQDREKGVPVRKVVVSEFVSLDGVMEDPGWTFQFSGGELEKFKFDELAESDALLLGRTTYEGFAAAWPNRWSNTRVPAGQNSANTPP
jgi:dihydrofolate reductase